jgi:hypothetical protein
MTGDERRELLEDVFTALTRCRVYNLARRNDRGEWVPVSGELGMARGDLSRALAGLNGGVVPMPREPREPALPPTPGAAGPVRQSDELGHLARHSALLAEVADRLNVLGGPGGYSASVEYPGFVQVTNPDGTCWNIGTANGDWGGDLSDGGGSHLGGAFEVPGSAGWCDPSLIAREVLARILPGNGADGK